MRKQIIEGMLALFVVTLGISSVSLAHQVGGLRDERSVLAAQVAMTWTSSTPTPVPVAPKIISLDPTYGAIGTQVTIMGSGFSATNNTIYFSYHQLSGIPSADGTRLSFSIPSVLVYTCVTALPCPTNTSQKVVPGIYNVMVLSGNGKSNAVSFMVIDRVTVGNKIKITSIQPASGRVGTKVTITGTGFTGSNNNITFGYIRLAPVRSNGRTLTFVVPPVDPRVYPLWVTNSRGVSNVMEFKVLQSSPTVTPTPKPSFTPTTSANPGGTVLPSKSPTPSQSGTPTPTPKPTATATPVSSVTP